MDSRHGKIASDAAIVLTSLEGSKEEYALRFDFKATNNKAEYEALLAGVPASSKLGLRGLLRKRIADKVVSWIVA